MRLNNSIQIAQAIKQARLSLGWTQTELAERVETTQAVISKFENQGEGRISTLLRIIEALDLQLLVLQRKESPLWSNQVKHRQLN